MNRSLIVVVLIAVLGAGYYFYSQGGGGGDATGEMIDSAAESTSEAAGAMNEALMTAEGYDAEKVAGMIDASDMDDTMKTQLKQSLETAASDPALLQGVLEQVKQLLGM